MNEAQGEQNQAEDPILEMFGEIIYAYTREQALEDGVLVDVSQTAKEAGFKWPVAMTAEVWGLIGRIPKKFDEDVQGRLWDVLWMARHAISRAKPGEEEILYDLILHQVDSNRLWLKIHCGPGDNCEPVLTIMLPDQD